MESRRFDPTGRARESAQLWDISPSLTPGIAVFPGDTPLSRDVLMRCEDGDPVTLSTLHATVHLGAHVDAPMHYSAGAHSIDAVPLERLLGPCRLVRPGGADTACERRLTAAALAAALERVAARPGALPALPPRVLIATGSFPDPTGWRDDFLGLAPATVERLAAAGVRTVGIDTPSMDPAASKDLPAHAAFLRHDVTILEGLMLEGVPEGDYELLALPLRLVGFDASPVRAILRELPSREDSRSA
jgi:arylformamidase